MRSFNLSLACFALVTGVALAQNNYELPSIGQPADTSLSPAEESEIGRDIVRQLRELNYFLDDAELATYLKGLGRRIAAYSGHDPDSFHFYVIRDPQINAFALPGGHIGVNAGLILASRGESELAGVVAHEIAHVTQRHIARQQQASGPAQIATAAALLLAILAGAGDPDIVQAAIAVGLSASAQQRINFTRAHELEADRVGIQTMTAAGFDPRGMASFFQYMEERGRLYGGALPEILLTHPVSNTRISEALARIGDQPRLAPVANDGEYRLMQARLRVMSAKQVSAASDFFTAEDKEHPVVQAYGRSLAQYRAGQYEPSIKTLQQLWDEHPTQVHYVLALARGQLAAGQNSAALKSFEQAERSFAGYPPLVLTHAEALIQSGQPEAARRRLLASDLIHAREPEVHRLLALAARDLNHAPEAHYQMAEFHRLEGDYLAAFNQVDAGLKLIDLRPSDHARLKTLKKTLEVEAPANVKQRKR